MNDRDLLKLIALFLIGLAIGLGTGGGMFQSAALLVGSGITAWMAAIILLAALLGDDTPATVPC